MKAEIDAPLRVLDLISGAESDLVPVPGHPGVVMLREDLERALADRAAADEYDRHTTAIDEYEQLGRAMALWPPPCRDDLRYVADALPFEDRAAVQEACLVRCPIRSQCDAYARRARPSSGVWAGRVYSN